MASTCVTQIHQSVSTRKRSHVRRGTFGPWNPEIYDKMFPSENYPPSKKYDSDRRLETPSRFNSTKQRVEQPSLQKSVDDHRFIGIIDIDVPNDMLFSSTAALLKLMGLAEEENVSNMLSDPAVGPASQTLAAATCTKTSEPRPSPIQNPSSSDVRALPTPNWTPTNLPAVHSSSLSDTKEPSVVPPIKFDASRPCSPSRTASPRETCAHAPKPLPQPHAPSLQQAAPPVKNAATTLVQAIPSSSKVATRSRPSSPRHGCLGLVGPRPRLTAKDPLRCNHSPDPGSRPSSAKSASPDRPLPTPPSTPKPPALSDVPQFTNPFAPQPILTVGKPEAIQHSQFQQQQQQQQQHKGKGKGKGKIRVLPAKPPSPRATIPHTPPSPSPTSPDIPIFTNPFAAASPPQRARPPPPNPLYDSPISPTSRRPFDVHMPYTPSSSTTTTTTTTVQIPFDPRSPTAYRKPSPPKHPDPSSKNELPIEGPVLSPVEGHHSSWSWGRASAAVEKDFTFPPQPLDNVRKLSQPIDPTRDLY